MCRSHAVDTVASLEGIYPHIMNEETSFADQEVKPQHDPINAKLRSDLLAYMHARMH